MYYRFVQACSWRYISDAITKDEGIEMLKKKEAGKKARTEEVMKRGYPAYTTSVGWLGTFKSLRGSQQLTSLGRIYR